MSCEINWFGMSWFWVSWVIAGALLAAYFINDQFIKDDHDFKVSDLFAVIFIVVVGWLSYIAVAIYMLSEINPTLVKGRKNNEKDI